MRVALVGASGNVGTALLRRFADDGTVTSVVGIARRPPPASVLNTPHDLPAPYDVATWARCDIAYPGPDEPVVARLAELLAGADAVVHLAWSMQPSHDRVAMSRTNVTGTRRVTEATLLAGVPHLVVASSVGAYSPAPDDGPRREAWPIEGVRSSEYSLDKVAVERGLDEVEYQHPRLVVARVRSALVFQRAAGRQVTRNFLGRLVPARQLLGRELPTLPWPRGFRIQAVHADDVASAYREIVVRRQRGPFNIAADDVLHGGDVAALISGGRYREVAPELVRTAVAAAWHARIVPVSPGWVDLAGAVPVLDTARAAHLLGWRPMHSSTQSLAEVLAGIAEGAGNASPPLRPRRGVLPRYG